MEREKQKTAEKEREKRDHAALMEQRRLAEKAVASSDAMPFLVKSKFVSEKLVKLKYLLLS